MNIDPLSQWTAVKAMQSLHSSIIYDNVSMRRKYISGLEVEEQAETLVNLDKCRGTVKTLIKVGYVSIAIYKYNTVNVLQHLEKNTT